MRGKAVVSNATRWDTFGRLVEGDLISENEKKFRQRYTKAPSFLSVHLGVRADVLPVRGGADGAGCSSRAARSRCRAT